MIISILSLYRQRGGWLILKCLSTYIFPVLSTVALALTSLWTFQPDHSGRMCLMTGTARRNLKLSA